MSKIRHKIDFALITVSVILIACRLLYTGMIYATSGVMSITSTLSDILCLIVVTIWLIVLAEVMLRLFVSKHGGKTADD